MLRWTCCIFTHNIACLASDILYNVTFCIERTPKSTFLLSLCTYFNRLVLNSFSSVSESNDFMPFFYDQKPNLSILEISIIFRVRMFSSLPRFHSLLFANTPISYVSESLRVFLDNASVSEIYFVSSKMYKESLCSVMIQ